jgi:predicted small integral membrane protein
MIGSLALFAGLVTFDNLTDYETNSAFVRHVLSTDTTPPGNPLMYRSISSPSSWRVAYALIIAGEGATAFAFAGARRFCCCVTCGRSPHGSTAPKV